MPASTTAAHPATRACCRSPAPPTTAAAAPAPATAVAGAPLPPAHELRVLVGCGWHTVRRACPQGIVMGAHAAGRVAEALRPRPALDPE